MRATSLLAQDLSANAAMAEVLDQINPSGAGRLRSCYPGKFRCGQNKLCAFCAEQRKLRLNRKRSDKLNDISQAAHLTLTTYPTAFLKRLQFQSVAGKFQSLRRRHRFAEAVAGGVFNIEADYGSGWLIHLHAVLDMRASLPLSYIKAEWQDLGGGRQLRLSPITPGTQARTFLYSTKKPALPLSVELVRQFINASHGFQFTRSWGTQHPLHLRRPNLKLEKPNDHPRNVGAVEKYRTQEGLQSGLGA